MPVIVEGSQTTLFVLTVPTVRPPPIATTVPESVMIELVRLVGLAALGIVPVVNPEIEPPPPELPQIHAPFQLRC